MLRVLESMLQSLFDSVVKSLTARVDDAVKSVALLKTSLGYSQQNIKDLKHCTSKLEEINTEIDQLNSDLTERDLKLEYLENQSRKNNICIKGFPEMTEQKTWQDVEDKVKEAITTKLDLDADMERAHHVNHQDKHHKKNINSPENQPRTILCCLHDWKHKKVLKKARKEKLSGLQLREDVALSTPEKRQAHLEKFKAAKQAGKIAYFVLHFLTKCLNDYDQKFQFSAITVPTSTLQFLPDGGKRMLEA